MPDDAGYGSELVATIGASMKSYAALPYTIVVVLAVALHFVFIGYLVFGGFLAWRRPATIGLHMAVAGWGAASLTLSLPCPLTDLERFGRAGAGMGELPAEGFIEHYLTGVWYPADYTAAVQALVFCTVVGSWLGLAARRQRRSPGPGPAADSPASSARMLPNSGSGATGPRAGLPRAGS